MKEYILLNKDKLIRTFKWTAIILTTAFCITTYYNCDSENCFITSDFIVGLSMTLVILPGSALVLEILRDYNEYWKTEKFFDSNPMTELLKNGFNKDHTDKESKWLLSKLCIVGQFDTYTMICEVDSGRLRVIAKADYRHLDAWDKKDIKSIQQSFKHVRFEYDGQGIATLLKVSDVKKMTYDNFVTYLSEFVKMLKELKVN